MGLDGLSFSIGSESGEAKIEDSYDVVILGAGPAGLTAAIYTSRAKLKTLVVEKEAVGGEAAATDLIENYPGFPEGITGGDLAQKMEEQAKRFGAEIVFADVESVELQGNPKSLVINGKRVEAKAVIIATGTSPRELGVPGEKEFKGRGVSYCATCDAPIFAGKDVAVIGCGNSGLQEGLYILKFAKSATFVEFLPTIKAEKILQDRIKAQPNVTCLLNHEVVEIKGDVMVNAIVVRDRATGETKEIPVQGVFVYIGLLPNTELFKGKIELNKWGYITVDRKLQTSVPGVFAAGDVIDKDVRQVATAVGDGATAAVSAQSYIEELEAAEVQAEQA